MSKLRTVAVIVLIYLAGAAAGYGAYLIHVPLPWMIGSMIVAAIATPALRVPRPPARLRMAGQVIVGAAMGHSLTPDALERVFGALPFIAGTALLTIALGWGLGILLVRVARIDRATAIFSSVPAGPVEMANLAELNGGDGATTALMQTIRIVLIVTIFPQIVVAAGGSGTSLLRVQTSVGDWIWLLPLGAVAIVGALAAKLARVMNPFFIGPLLMIGVLTSVGLPFSDVPDVVVAGGQVLLGVSLGSMFRRETFRDGGPALLKMLPAMIALLIGCVAISGIVSMVSDLPFITMVLANAPGGATEMALVARAIGVDVPIVIAFQVSRIVLIAIMLPVLYSLLLGRGPKGGKT